MVFIRPQLVPKAAQTLVTLTFGSVPLEAFQARDATVPTPLSPPPPRLFLP